MKKIILFLVIILIALVALFFLQYGGGFSLVGIPHNNNINSQNKNLNLSNQGLTSIPMSVFDQINLEELNVSHNSLSGAIQSQIGQLKNLKILNASYNQMTGVPAEMGQLQNLQILDLSYNQLTGLPNELGNLKNLKTLNLAGNLYSQQDLNGIRSKLPTTVNIILNEIEYKNQQYGFKVLLPEDWKGYTVITGEWQGFVAERDLNAPPEEIGPQISIRNPLWTRQKPYQDIPIMVFTLEQWSALSRDQFHIGAAPINPSKLTFNGKYVFALPARYNYAFSEGWQEVDQIIQKNSVQPLY